jgi:hypothetical protein
MCARLCAHGALRTALSAVMSGEQDTVTGENNEFGSRTPGRIDVGKALIVLAR